MTPCTARMGTQVIVPYREEDEKRHLKPMGDLGQIVPMVMFFQLEALVICLIDVVRHGLGMEYPE